MPEYDDDPTRPAEPGDGIHADDPSDGTDAPWGGIGLTSPNVRGPQVFALQRRLFHRGYLHREPDGVFDGETAAAVRWAKEAHGIPFTADDADRATPELIRVLGDDDDG
jgi:peptidoglycan hydrolase-like protein with peptidoglycan-binding domain